MFDHLKGLAIQEKEKKLMTNLSSVTITLMKRFSLKRTASLIMTGNLSGAPLLPTNDRSKDWSQAYPCPEDPEVGPFPSTVLMDRVICVSKKTTLWSAVSNKQTNNLSGAAVQSSLWL